MAFSFVFCSLTCTFAANKASFDTMKMYRLHSRFIAYLLTGWMLVSPASVQAQYEMEEKTEPLRPLSELGYRVELQASASDGVTPLWLNANRHGLSSLEKLNGYLRAAVERPLQRDSDRHWGIGYGLDLVAASHFQQKVIVQQAYAEGRWLHGALTIGAKEWPMELKNQQLSSGSQALGINARPVPQLRLALRDYWTLPFTNGWLHLKGHIAYGRLTDESWQHDFTQRQHLYVDGGRYHSKAGYLKIGNEERFCPWSMEMGLEMASQYGGTTHRPGSGGNMETIENESGMKAAWKAFIPGGSEVTESTYKGAEGNQLGAWVARLNYDTDTWAFSIYADKFFEDHSAMFQLDYDGYGKGDEWNEKKKSRFLVYELKDIMAGAELLLKNGYWLRNIVVEYIHSEYQSGPVYHDHTPSISDHIGGVDNYYNHYLYTGWQHWGQVIGNPLYRSPIYNDSGVIQVENNRMMAFHIGVSGEPTEQLSYRFLATWQEGLGTYQMPYTKKRHNVSLMLETQYLLPGGWSIKGAVGADTGKIYGNNMGAQLTLTKRGIIGK